MEMSALPLSMAAQDPLIAERPSTMGEAGPVISLFASGGPIRYAKVILCALRCVRLDVRFQVLHYDETTSFFTTLLGSVSVAIGPRIPLAYRPERELGKSHACDHPINCVLCARRNHPGSPLGPAASVRRQ